MSPRFKRNDIPPVPKIRYNDDGSLIIPQQSTEFDGKSVQATSPLNRIELMEKSIPGMSPLCITDSANTMGPAAIPRRRTDSKDKSISAMEEAHPMRKDASQYKVSPSTSRFESKDKSTRDVESIRRFESKDESIRGLAFEPVLRTEPEDNFSHAPSTIRKIKSTDTIVPATSRLCRLGSNETIMPTPVSRIESKDESIQDLGFEPIHRNEPKENFFHALSPIRKVKSTDTVAPTTSPLRRSDSNETIMPTPVKMRRTKSKSKDKDKSSPAMDGTHPISKSTSGDKSIPAMEETTPIRKNTFKDKSSPTLRRIKSALSIKQASTLARILKDVHPLARLRDMHPHAISLLRAMCFFEPTDIRKRYLIKICDRYSSRAGGAEATLSNFPVRHTDLELTLHELIQVQFISDSENALGVCVEDEVREEMLNQLANMPEVFEVAFATAVVVLYELWPSMTGLKSYEQGLAVYESDNLWGGRDELVVHVKALKSLFKKAKGVVRERCASRRYMVLLVEAAWYYYERARYHEADLFVEAAFQTKNLACMVPNSLLANLHRTSAAIALELGDIDRMNSEVEQFIHLYPGTFPQPHPAAGRTWHCGRPAADWAYSNKAILHSGLLAEAPDGVGLSPWGFDKVQGFPHLAPFLSLRHFGWMNYAEGRYARAAICFLKGMGDRRVAFDFDDRRGPRTGELLYALGLVRNAQGRYEEGLSYFQRALAQFKKTDEDGPSMAKAHYKIARYYLEKKQVVLAGNHLEAAEALYSTSGTGNEHAPHLARVYYQIAANWDLYGDPANREAALKITDAYRARVVTYRPKVETNPDKPPKPLGEIDFDVEVGIWAQ